MPQPPLIPNIPIEEENNFNGISGMGMGDKGGGGGGGAGAAAFVNPMFGGMNNDYSLPPPCQTPHPQMMAMFGNGCNPPQNGGGSMTTNTVGVGLGQLQQHQQVTNALDNLIIQVMETAQRMRKYLQYHF